ncbi:histidine triad nucleotide-binding protein [soil metagenome]
MDNCLFCKIAAKQIPSTLIYEDDEVMAFHDIHPAAPVHFLIIPKQHVATLSDCDETHADLLGKMLLLAPRLAREQGCGYTVDADGTAGGGFKTQFNTGPDGGQEVYHLHMHVIGGPRPWRGQR